MSQHDYNIANGGGAAVRADINDALLAILSQNSGATAPTTTKPFMFWHDTATGELKMRNAADTAWIAAGEVITGGNLQAMKNRLINGAFSINQRAVSGTVTLAAGAYGHDRWKAGASGCTYTFATSNGLTTLTISAGSLQQVVEGVNVPDGTNTLVMSWTGTAQGKIGAGSYAISGVTASVTGGSNLTVEFGTGTLTKVQLEKGSTATSFDYRQHGTELALCQRYYTVNTYTVYTGANPPLTVPFKVSMRTTPTLAGGGAGFSTTALNSELFQVYQTTPASQTITATAEL